MINEVDTIVLDNNKEYFKVTELTINNINYYLLNNIDDKSDFVIRKEVNDEIVGLDNEDEFNLIVNKLINKN